MIGRYLLDGGSYSEIEQIRLELRQVGIDARITAGGLNIYVDTEDQYPVMKKICTNHSRNPHKADPGEITTSASETLESLMDKH